MNKTFFNKLFIKQVSRLEEKENTFVGSQAGIIRDSFRNSLSQERVLKYRSFRYALESIAECNA